MRRMSHRLHLDAVRPSDRIDADGDLRAHRRGRQPVGRRAPAGHHAADRQPPPAGAGALAGRAPAAALDPCHEADRRRRALLRRAPRSCSPAGRHSRPTCAAPATSRRACCAWSRRTPSASSSWSAPLADYLRALSARDGRMAAARPRAGLHRRGHRLRDPGRRRDRPVRGGDPAGRGAAHRGGRARRAGEARRRPRIRARTGARCPGWRCAPSTATRSR